MEQSILKSVKKMVNLHESDDSFDLDVLMHINTVFSTLHQLGVGPSEGFMIEDAEAKWEDFLPSKDNRLNMVRSYIGFRVRLMFDPPATSFAIDSMQKQVDELTWRLNVAVDPGDDFVIPDRETREEYYNPFMADVDSVVVEPL